MKHKLAGTAIAIGLLAACVSAQSTGQATGTVDGVVFTVDANGGHTVIPLQEFRCTVQHTLRLRVMARASSHSMQFLLGRTRSMHRHPAWPQIGPSRLRRALLRK